ncbi:MULTISPECIES: DUF4258 domain-containing protein [Oceanobacillus]|uniref:DUF4258 domain-containing protein n=1 Tax=Oceanobacillus kimchii TaxID=746691 RepID=A0ABQ5TNC3_9BACI|nr:DUF4258 domain-containing protein [Oceanobacillus kimchii]GLO68304.1 hypothetical protein MACH08_40880 [Oceanobacillus kimchii]
MTKRSRIKHIKKCLLLKKILISIHSKERMSQRGYSSCDIIRAVLNGRIIEVQSRGYTKKFVIEGKDYSDNPIVIVLSEKKDGYCLVTAMPPTDKNRFSECI